MRLKKWLGKRPSSGSIRVDRGGSWVDDPRYARVAYRLRFAPSLRWLNLGVRLCRRAPCD